MTTRLTALNAVMLSPHSTAVLTIVDTIAQPPTFLSYGSSPDSIPDGGAGSFTINRTGNTSVSASIDFLIVAPGGG
ncbi:MAG: hypothetical protein ACRC62_29605 [Microcoleus sp.]